jgi:hypothetical protein
MIDPRLVEGICATGAVRVHDDLVRHYPAGVATVDGDGEIPCSAIHARLMADLLIERLGGQAFTWGGSRLSNVGELRAQYIAALKLADNHDVHSLLQFARS